MAGRLARRPPSDADPDATRHCDGALMIAVWTLCITLIFSEIYR